MAHSEMALLGGGAGHRAAARGGAPV